MQAKLHGGRWPILAVGSMTWSTSCTTPATLREAFWRVATNQGANTPGVDGITAAWVDEQVGVPGFLEDVRAALKDRSFHRTGQAAGR